MNEILPLAIGIGSLGANITILTGVLLAPGGLLLHDAQLTLLLEIFFFLALTGYLFARLLTKVYNRSNNRGSHGPNKSIVQEKRGKSSEDGEGQQAPKA